MTHFTVAANHALLACLSLRSNISCLAQLLVLSLRYFSLLKRTFLNSMAMAFKVKLAESGTCKEARNATVCLLFLRRTGGKRVITSFYQEGAAVNGI
jgi:hypothetical protein